MPRARPAHSAAAASGADARRTVAIAPAAPTRPPIANERSLLPRAGAVHATILLVRITTLGDLLLDVIVQLDQPLVPGDDQTAATRTGAGGQAANVAAWACELGADGALRRQARRRHCRAR